MLQQLGRARGDGRVEERQMDRQVGIDVGHLHKHRPRRHGDGQLLPALSDQRLGLGLAGLHLAAYKFPQKPTGLVGRALADQKSVSVPDQGGHYFGHGISSCTPVGPGFSITKFVIHTPRRSTCCARVTR